MEGKEKGEGGGLSIKKRIERERAERNRICHISCVGECSTIAIRYGPN